MGSKRLLIGLVAFNEMHRIKPVVEQLLNTKRTECCGIVFADDGSTDGTYEYLLQIAEANGIGLIRHNNNQGVGSTIRDIIFYGKEKQYDVLTIASSNGKTDISELKNMYQPVLDGKYDYVKGSRFCKNGKYENMPLFRIITIPIFSFFVSLIMWKRVSDATCLINASNLKIYDDHNININQSWLDKYELEYYILFYVLKLNYRFVEVPMTIRYPAEKRNYSKIKPFIDWWKMIKPWIVLKLGIRK